MASYATNGRLSVSSWEATSGERRYMTRVVAQTIRFMDSKPQAEPDTEGIPEGEEMLYPASLQGQGELPWPLAYLIPENTAI